jgi:Alpha-2-macroglobulin family N-terminal region.
MRFSEDEVRPGESLKLHLKAAPNSKVAITAVDTSIHFLAKGNDIKQKDVRLFCSVKYFLHFVRYKI